MTPLVALVVVTWRSGSVVGDCLASFAREIGDRRHEIVVIDNGPPDGTEEIVRAEAPHATYVANGRNRGLPAANNQGIAATSAPLVLISNPDVVYRPGSLDALLAAAARHPRAAFLVPKLVHHDGSLQPDAGDLPTFREAMAGRAAQHRRGGTTGFWWDGWAHDEERAIGHGGEAAYLVRRAAIDDMGPQDERYVLDWEGIEWSRRARDHGWEVWFCPWSEVVHLGGISITQAQARWVRGTHTGMYHYFTDGRRWPARVGLGAAVWGRAGLKLAALAAGRALYERSRPRASR